MNLFKKFARWMLKEELDQIAELKQSAYDHYEKNKKMESIIDDFILQQRITKLYIENDEIIGELMEVYKIARSEPYKDYVRHRLAQSNQYLPAYVSATDAALTLQRQQAAQAQAYAMQNSPNQQQFLQAHHANLLGGVGGISGIGGLGPVGLAQLGRYSNKPNS